MPSASCIIGKGDLDLLLSRSPLDEDRLAKFLYKDNRAKGIVRLLIVRKNFNFNETEEVFQQSVLAFFDPSKKHEVRLIDRMDGSSDGFYRLWWGVCKNVIGAMLRESHREDHFGSDEHEEAAIQDASIKSVSYNGSFEAKVETLMVCERFNLLFDRGVPVKMQKIIDKAMATPKGSKTKGRPLKVQHKGLVLPFASELALDSAHTEQKQMPEKTMGGSRHLLPFASGFELDVKANSDQASQASKEVNDKVDAEKKSARLSAIRKLLGISISKYAEEIGIPEYRLISYLYTRVQKIPEDVIDRAENLFEVGKNTALSTASIADMSMPQILQIWRSKIRGTNEDLEKKLGLSSSTLPRWESGITRPSVRRIKDYCRIVDKSVSQKSRAGQ